MIEKLMEKLLSKWQFLQHFIFYIVQNNLQRMTYKAKLIFSVGDTALGFTFNIEQENWNWGH